MHKLNFEKGQKADSATKFIVSTENVINNLFLNFFPQESNFSLSNEDVHISYLPLAHMMERICQAMVFMNGGKIGFYRGDVKLLIEDIQALKPTMFVSVPRLLNRVYDKVGVCVCLGRAAGLGVDVSDIIMM